MALTISLPPEINDKGDLTVNLLFDHNQAYRRTGFYVYFYKADVL